MRLRTAEAAMLCDPHLVLADVAGEDRSVTRGFRQFLEQRGRVDASARRVVARRPHDLLRAALLHPAGRIGPRGQTVEDRRQIARQADFGDAQLADLGRVAVDVNDLRARSEAVELAGRAVVEARADADQQVAIVDRHVRCARSVHSKHAEEVRIAGRNAAEALQGGDGGDARCAWQIRAARARRGRSPRRRRSRGPAPTLRRSRRWPRRSAASSTSASASAGRSNGAGTAAITPTSFGRSISTGPGRPVRAM